MLLKLLAHAQTHAFNLPSEQRAKTLISNFVMLGTTKRSRKFLQQTEEDRGIRQKLSHTLASNTV